MVKVYQCKSWDDGQAMWIVNRGHFTIEAIKKLPKTEIVPGTEREVEESALDENGRVNLRDDNRE